MKEGVRKNKEQAREQPGQNVSGSGAARKDQSHALSRIDISGNSLTMAMHSGMGIASVFMREIFLREMLPIVGMRYQGGTMDLLKDIRPGSRILFMREPENRFDRKAIMALDEQGRKLGYISRHENEVLSALMDAGKTLYGVVTHIPDAGELRSSGMPTVMYADLYMREFAMPDDMTEIPRQGHRGSYAVMDLELTEDEEPKIRGVFAIRVINGEERGIISEYVTAGGEDGEHTGAEAEQERNAPEEEYGTLVRRLRKAVGYLPVVIFDRDCDQRSALETGWGIYAGSPFSNQVIEISEMAANHLPELLEPSLENLVKRLGIEAEGDTAAEKRCRQIWQCYCRMDRSELGKRVGANAGK